MKPTDVILPSDFLKDIPNIGYPAVNLFIYFRLLRELSRLAYPERFAWVRAGYDTIMENTRIKSKGTLLSARLQLAELGWIADYIRGGYNPAGDNTTNSYCIMDSKLKTPNVALIKSWGGALNITEEQVKPSNYVVSLRNLRQELVEGNR